MLDGRLVDIDQFPDDFQVVLTDHLYRYVRCDWDRYTRQVLVEIGLTIDHEQEVMENADGWSAYDRMKCRDYLHLYKAGHKPPPLLAEHPGDLLLDGYHRMWVYYELGIASCDFIYLDNQYLCCKEISNDVA